MKNNLLLGMLFLLIASCSDSVSDDSIFNDSDGFIRVTANGERISTDFATGSISQVDIYGDTIYTLYINGVDPVIDLDDLENLVIAITSINTVLSEGTYTTADEIDVIDEMNEMYERGTWVQSAFGNAEGSLWGTNRDGAELTVNLSELNFEIGGRVRGTFFGTAINEDTGEEFVLEDGEFSAIVE